MKATYGKGCASKSGAWAANRSRGSRCASVPSMPAQVRWRLFKHGAGKLSALSMPFMGSVYVSENVAICARRAARASGKQSPDG